uniref:Uncharacterized protein n=1 Tax=Marmota marmota marmota TaxID=9994 RepID=A0A8C5ZN71_MARMA
MNQLTPEDGILCLGWPGTCDPPASASQVAGITDMHHCAWKETESLMLFKFQGVFLLYPREYHLSYAIGLELNECNLFF